MDWENKEEVKKRVQKAVEKYWYLLPTLLVALGIFLIVFGILKLAK